MSKKWTLEELQKLYDTPLLRLISKAHQVHVTHHNPEEIQVCHLISIKTGGCPEDCKYCSQSSRYQTETQAEGLMSYAAVLERAKKAVDQGATRICLGAAWREARTSTQFERVLDMVKGITELGVEVCCTLGMLSREQAKQLKEAGLYAYNHNLDTSEKFYPTIITTRSFKERLETHEIVQSENLSLCSGGILGLGETIQDRLELILALCNRPFSPESVPINRLTAIPGTPLENQPPVPFWEFLKIVALTRITLPSSIIRLSSGRKDMSEEEQALCFLAGANSIFAGEKLLTVSNTSSDLDEKMFKNLELTKRPPFLRETAYESCC